MVQKQTKRRRVKRNIDELQLTPGERFLINRKRNGWDQNTAAKKEGISSFAYKMIEYDKGTALTPPIIKELFLHEKCLIYRRRCGQTQMEVAKELGVCREWMRQMESGKVNCDSLIWHWEA